MNDFNIINQLIKEKNWPELEKFFSSLTSFPEDKDGNPEFLYFFQNNIPEAIILAEKFSLINQSDIIISLKFCSSSFKNNLIIKLLEAETLKPKNFFQSLNSNENSFLHLSLISSDTFNLIINYYKDNNLKNVYDKDFIKTIFSKEAIENIVNMNQQLFVFILKLSDINNFFLFNKYTTKENFNFLNIIISHIKDNIEDLDFKVFQTETQNSILYLKKRFSHPFVPKHHKETIQIILEDIEKINLFLELKNKKFESNKKNKQKI